MAERRAPVPWLVVGAILATILLASNWTAIVERVTLDPYERAFRSAQRENSARGDAPAATTSDRVRAEIASSTDCRWLQSTFDRNMDDFDRRSSTDPLRSVVLSYGNAAHDRMNAIGCYD